MAHFHIVVMVGTYSGFEVLDSLEPLALGSKDVHCSALGFQSLAYQAGCPIRFHYPAIRQITDFVKALA